MTKNLSPDAKKLSDMLDDIKDSSNECSPDFMRKTNMFTDNLSNKFSSGKIHYEELKMLDDELEETVDKYMNGCEINKKE